MDIDAMLAAGAPPIMAILRGVKPEEAVAIAAALVDAGIRLIEVPLNSPEPFDSIRRLQEALGAVACIGAGTVVERGVGGEAGRDRRDLDGGAQYRSGADRTRARARPAAHARLPDAERGLRRDRRGGDAPQALSGDGLRAGLPACAARSHPAATSRSGRSVGPAPATCATGSTPAARASASVPRSIGRATPPASWAAGRASWSRPGARRPAADRAAPMNRRRSLARHVPGRRTQAAAVRKSLGRNLTHGMLDRLGARS